MESRYVDRDDGEFPERLKLVKPPIKGLWVKGEYELINSQKIVAIVGSRKMSLYGKRVLAEIVPKLVEMGYVTISGFMYGIDIEMHRLTLENEGKTIGVFGWGIDAPIIPENQNLYHKAIESGSLFLSELEPNRRGELWTFPLRNRIVVGLSDMVIVIEAGMKSGSLSSANWARKLGKPVYAIPGSIFSTVSLGCNWLLEQNLAKPMTLGFFTDNSYSEKARMNRKKGKMNEGESTLVTLLTLEGPLSLNELSRKLARTAGEVGADLTSLLLKGEVSEERGMWSSR
ncbi:MAG: DNA-processing protein DprA [bacterium]